jgi:hypothetical protein
MGKKFAGQQPQSGFGATTATPSSFGSAFGQNISTTTPFGGATSTTTTPFGGASTGTSSVFGGGSSTGAFGSTAPNTSSSFSFGQPAQQQQQAGTTSVFGGFGQPQQQQPAASGGKQLLYFCGQLVFIFKVYSAVVQRRRLVNSLQLPPLGLVHPRLAKHLLRQDPYSVLNPKLLHLLLVLGLHRHLVSQQLLAFLVKLARRLRSGNRLQQVRLLLDLGSVPKLPRNHLALVRIQLLLLPQQQVGLAMSFRIVFLVFNAF